ncbi:hypothetical protein [Salipiger sp. PrR007]|uniref:oxidoreductase n=1 Tax=Salipiger sp. PrR007 TaxID=2706884 RepID=UPI0013B90496|nr:hypothetical protein [Salipiger sp. PrR007]NDW32952.1 hypothetical protein [Salipiger sp. PrR007]
MKKIFSQRFPKTIRDTGVLKNKLTFFVGVNTGYVTDGLPDDRYVEFYRRRSSPRLHCAIIGNVVIPEGHGSNSSTPMLTQDQIWGRIAAEIADQGTVPGIQLATTWRDYQGMRSFVGQDHEAVISSSRDIVRSIGRRGALKVISAFGEGANLAIDHGFRHIQVHGAHGYLLSLLIDQRINPHADEVLKELSEAASNWISKGVDVSIRVSLRTGAENFDLDGADEFNDNIASTPFNYVDLSSGFYNIDKRLIYPSRPDIVASRLSETLAVASRHPRKNFIYSGKAVSNVAHLVADNVHLGICRDIIANPDFLNDGAENWGCKNKSKCHYFSRGMQSLTCALWENNKIEK